MSVQARVEDALLLWKSGRREGAFLDPMERPAPIVTSGLW
jgi:hypothetical protein